MIEDQVCKTCAAGHYLISGYCDHCNSVQEGSTPDLLHKRISELEAMYLATKEIADGLASQLDEWKRCATDPQCTHTNILRKTIALTREQALHIAGATDYDNLSETVQRLERENAELIEQLSCESMEVEQLRLQVVRLRKALLEWKDNLACLDIDKILSETPPQAAKALLGTTVELLRTIRADFICGPEITTEIARLERLMT